MPARRLGIVLAVWSAGFACVHVAWALGWRYGVPPDQPPISERPVFLTYDLVAAVLMYAAAWVALRVAAGRRDRWLLRATVVGSVLALLRGVPALVIDLATADVAGVGFAADLWFTVAGVLGLMLARAASPGRSRAPGPRPPAGGAR